MADQFNNPLKTFMRNFQNYRQRLPLRISQRALLEMKENFQRGGYEGETGFIAWKKRAKNSKIRRALLIKTSRLRRSLKAAPAGSDPRVVTDVEYAGIHQNGFKGVIYVQPHKRIATRKVKIKGSYTKLGDERKSRTVKMNGARHNVKSFARRVNIPARPFLTVGPSFLNKEEAKLLDELENLFLQS